MFSKWDFTVIQPKAFSHLGKNFLRTQKVHVGLRENKNYIFLLFLLSFHRDRDEASNKALFDHNPDVSWVILRSRIIFIRKDHGRSTWVIFVLESLPVNVP